MITLAHKHRKIRALVIAFATMIVCYGGSAVVASASDMSTLCGGLNSTPTVLGGGYTCSDPRAGTFYFDQSGNRIGSPAPGSLVPPGSDVATQCALVPGGKITSDGNGGFVCSGPQTGQLSYDKTGTYKQPGQETCSLLGSWSFNDCIWVPLMEWLGSWFLTMGAALLKLSGLLFDMLIGSVIISFGQTLQNLGVIAAITTGWDAFRDLANILIIGMFTFIAISTILGSKEYGYKKLVARVIIIAVLMNFSLLFTKLIIDASNFTAYQFYNQMSGQSAQVGSNTSPSFDTAAAFLTPLGITSVWSDTENLPKQVGGATGSGVQAFLTGFIGGILLVAIAAVLFYGVILIATRAVMIIVLMLTSAVAFATYLLPKFAESKYGWKGWWEALINCAVFAPLLMLFLSLSLLIVHGAVPSTGSITMGSIIANTTDASSSSSAGWTIIITYIITVGLLYVSLKISSQFASMASGISLAGMAAGTLALATGGVTGLVARNTVGRLGSNRLETLQNRITAKGEGYEPTKWETRRMEAYKSLSTKTFDPTKTKLGASLTKGAVGSSALKDAGKGGYDGVKDRQAKAAAKRADGIAISKERIAAVTTAKDQKNLDAAKVIREDVIKTKKESQPDRPSFEGNLKAHQAAQEQDLSDRKSKTASYESQMSAAKQRIQNAADEATRRSETQKLAEIENRKMDDLGAIDARITTREANMGQLRTKLVQLNAEAEGAVDASINHIISAAEAKIATAKSAAKGIAESQKEAIGKNIAYQRWGTLVGRTLGTSDITRDPVASRIGKAFSDNKHHKAMKDLVDTIGHENEGHAAGGGAGGGGAGAHAAPPGGGAGAAHP